MRNRICLEKEIEMKCISTAYLGKNCTLIQWHNNFILIGSIKFKPLRFTWLNDGIFREFNHNKANIRSAIKILLLKAIKLINVKQHEPIQLHQIIDVCLID